MSLPHVRTAHSGHTVFPHDHQWQLNVWNEMRRPCTGHWFCQSCRVWFTSEPCPTVRVLREPPARVRMYA